MLEIDHDEDEESEQHASGGTYVDSDILAKELHEVKNKQQTILDSLEVLKQRTLSSSSSSSSSSHGSSNNDGNDAHQSDSSSDGVKDQLKLLSTRTEFLVEQVAEIKQLLRQNSYRQDVNHKSSSENLDGLHQKFTDLGSASNGKNAGWDWGAISLGIIGLVFGGYLLSVLIRWRSQRKEEDGAFGIGGNSRRTSKFI